MGFFDFFKGKKEIKKEILRLDELDKWIKTKKEESLTRENEIIREIKLKISDFIRDVEENINVLEKIDLEEKKIEDKIKFIVKENLDKYIFHLEKLTENLEKLTDNSNKLKINELINKVNLNFIDFDKRSMLNFEKATFIIGKELGAVKDSISNFFKNFNKIIDENKESFKSSDKILLVEEKLKEISGINRLKKDSGENVIKNTEKIKSSEEEIKIIEKEIKLTKKSKEYESEIQEKERIEDEKKKIINEMENLRDMIDFKQLSSIFHSEKKKMDIINKYRNSFKENFQDDSGKDIMRLLEEASMENEQITRLIKDISEREKKIEEKTQIIDLTKSPEARLIVLENHLRTIKNNIEDIKFEIDKEEKKISKFEENYKETIKLIKEELEKMNLELVF